MVVKRDEIILLGQVSQEFQHLEYVELFTNSRKDIESCEQLAQTRMSKEIELIGLEFSQLEEERDRGHNSLHDYCSCITGIQRHQEFAIHV